MPNLKSYPSKISYGPADDRLHHLYIPAPEASIRFDRSEIIAEGELIDEYPDGKPLPSVLLLGRVNHRATHVVLGVDSATGVCYVITVYLPDPGLWLTGFRKRRSP